MVKRSQYLILIVLVGGCADLMVTSIDDAQFQLNLLMMKSTVKNDGWWSAPASTTRLEVKTPTSDFTQRAVTPTPALGRGEQTELQMWPFHLNALVASGECIEARVCADSASAVNEGWFSGENNNCRTRSFCRN